MARERRITGWATGGWIQDIDRALDMSGGLHHGPRVCIPLEDAAAEKITASHVVVVSSGRKLHAEIKPSTLSSHPMAPVFLGASSLLVMPLVDGAIETSQSESPEALVPAGDALLTYDMGAEPRRSLGTRLESIPWLRVNRLDSYADPGAEELVDLLASGSVDVMVLIVPTNKLSHDFTRLKTIVAVTIVPKSATAAMLEDIRDLDAELPGSLYKGTLHDTISLPEPAVRKAAAIARWSEDQAEGIRRALRHGVESLTDQLVTGLGQP